MKHRGRDLGASDINWCFKGPQPLDTFMLSNSYTYWS